jgi:hypothetical protein
MAHESSGASQPDLFLKPVAVSAARLAPPRHCAAASKRAIEMAIYSLPGSARSPFHAEPAQVENEWRFKLTFAASARLDPLRQLRKINIA